MELTVGKYDQVSGIGSVWVAHILKAERILAERHGDFLENFHELSAHHNSTKAGDCQVWAAHHEKRFARVFCQTVELIIRNNTSRR
jgi:hypothetical protein